MTKRAVLIAGPTASGKSSLAIKIANEIDGIIVNADAIQVYKRWQVLSARPDVQELQRAPHALFGHVHKDYKYSVGEWIKEISLLFENTNKIPILTGGTGLYFGAFLNGLSEIPPIPDKIRTEADELRLSGGAEWFRADLEKSDPESLANMDQNNPARLQRAWEVLQTTGKGLAYWHKRPTRPVIPFDETFPILLNWQPDHLNTRIDERFDIMMKSGAIEECKAAIASGFDPSLPSSRAIGAREIIEAINGRISMEDAVIKGKLQTRQFAKRQRTWFRSKMREWHQINLPAEALVKNIVERCAASFH